ncbi:M28 family metallopeptidase [Novosphingobium lentum]|uniref:M28 family metallopeptidase n=1 Tax=Novosphingobium lentum TaxID=145287 RepID=UPI00082FEA6E|nr:M28 family peptidase [Novosphingobium lentum]
MSRCGRWQGVCGALVAVVAVVLLTGASPRREKPLEATLRAHIATLASDDFQGREPGTDGETKALRYLARQWFDIGLESGTNDPGHAWFAPVDLVERTPLGSRAVFMRGKRRVIAPEGQVYVVTSGIRSLVESAPVLFVGHGTGAVPARPELSGRIALMLDSLPPGVTADQAPDRQGRLLDGGAAAVITVLDDTRTIDGVVARRQRSGYALAGDRLGSDIEAFVSPALAQQMLAAGDTLAGLRGRAEAKVFVPALIGMTATLEATSKETRIHTHNLIGKLEGRDPSAGAVLVVAHWDHFGICATPPAEDLICNGAIDNASGLAVITEAARALSSGRPLDRDVYFLATTGEELGLLGAQAFAENPPVPLASIVAAFNVDSDALVPAGRPVAIIGRGMTGLDPEIEKVVRQMGKKLASGDAANAFARRQDSWALLQHDIPAVMVSTSYSDMERVDRFMETTYHRPSDELRPDLDLGGAADDVALQVALVRDFADVKRYPGKIVRVVPGKR